MQREVVMAPRALDRWRSYRSIEDCKRLQNAYAVLSYCSSGSKITSRSGNVNLGELMRSCHEVMLTELVEEIF